MGWTKFPFYESGQEEIGPGLLTTQMCSVHAVSLGDIIHGASLEIFLPHVGMVSSLGSCSVSALLPTSGFLLAGFPSPTVHFEVFLPWVGMVSPRRPSLHVLADPQVGSPLF